MPHDRVGVLIGPDGNVKSRIEKTFKVNLVIESESGNVEIVLNADQPDVSIIFTVANIVKAIGRGFSPDRAMLLGNEDFSLSIVELEEHVGPSRSTQERVKGRIIGRGGKSRALIEELTETQMSVYGSTIALIGNIESLPAATEAVMMLIRGKFHKTVYNYLFAYRRQLKKDRGEIWYDQPPPASERK
ncbi:MAG: RNA-processing protein [Candidatus Bathyarchaeota archaeon]|nr:RNA-processing protein [Candidatus Bathyarchaeota archaeon]